MGLVFDATLLGAAITKAIASIPPGLKATKELLASPTPDTRGALAELERVRAALVALRDIGNWLTEAKQLHELMQTLSEALLRIEAEQMLAKRSGTLRLGAYSFSRVRSDWDIIRRNNLPQIRAFATGIRFIEPDPLQIKGDGTITDGPLWASHLFQLEAEIEDLFSDLDQKAHVENVKLSLIDRLSAFCSHVRTVMVQADRRIREDSTDLGSWFSRLSDELDNA